MWRAFFFAIGTMLVIVGVECLLIDSATLAAEAPPPPQPQNGSFFQDPAPAAAVSTKVVKPAEWIPWSCIASGAVVILYALTLPSRSRGGGS